MAKLAKYTLSQDAKTKRWTLKSDSTRGGVLERAVSKSGTVKIKKRNGKIQEERTYPRKRDPRASKG